MHPDGWRTSLAPSGSIDCGFVRGDDGTVRPQLMKPQSMGESGLNAGVEQVGSPQTLPFHLIPPLSPMHLSGKKSELGDRDRSVSSH